MAQLGLELSISVFACTDDKFMGLFTGVHDTSTTVAPPSARHLKSASTCAQQLSTFMHMQRKVRWPCWRPAATLWLSAGRAW